MAVYSQPVAPVASEKAAVWVVAVVASPAAVDRASDSLAAEAPEAVPVAASTVMMAVVLVYLNPFDFADRRGH